MLNSDRYTVPHRAATNGLVERPWGSHLCPSENLCNITNKTGRQTTRSSHGSQYMDAICYAFFAMPTVAWLHSKICWTMLLSPEHHTLTIKSCAFLCCRPVVAVTWALVSSDKSAPSYEGGGKVPYRYLLNILWPSWWTSGFLRYSGELLSGA